MSDGGVIVADSGPIIHLSRVGLLDVLPALYGTIVVPSAVFREVVHDGAGQAGSVELAGAKWAEIVDHDDQDPLFLGFLRILQIGESAAISIAYARRAQLVLVDDNHARMSAKSLGLAVKGTLGLLVLAKQRGHIATVLPKIRELRSQHVWISAEVVRRALREAGEDESDVGG
jgi:uncharacterized protein